MDESFDPGAFRWAAADFLRCMIYARESADPGFLSDAEYERWQIDRGRGKAYRSHEILQKALDKLRFLDDKYVGPRSSGGLPLYEGPLGELRLEVGLFVCGDPEWSIPEVIEKLRNGEAVDWEELAQWDGLAEIRDALDQLPHPGTRLPGSNGPVPLDEFHWNGRRCRITRPLVWRLINYLWNCPNRTARFENLAEAVWEDHAVDIDESKFGSVRRDANTFFNDNGIPYFVQHKSVWVKIVDMQSDDPVS